MLILQGGGIIDDHFACHNLIDGMDRSTHILDQGLYDFVIDVISLNGDLSVLDFQVDLGDGDIHRRDARNVLSEFASSMMLGSIGLRVSNTSLRIFPTMELFMIYSRFLWRNLYHIIAHFLDDLHDSYTFYHPGGFPRK
jgi:hypothetical protein